MREVTRLMAQLAAETARADEAEKLYEVEVYARRVAEREAQHWRARADDLDIIAREWKAAAKCLHRRARRAEERLRRRTLLVPVCEAPGPLPQRS